MFSYYKSIMVKMHKKYVPKKVKNMRHICMLKSLSLNHICKLSLSKRKMFFSFERQLLLHSEEGLNIKSIFYP